MCDVHSSSWYIPYFFLVLLAKFSPFLDNVCRVREDSSVRDFVFYIFLTLLSNHFTTTATTVLPRQSMI